MKIKLSLMIAILMICFTLPAFATSGRQTVTTAGTAVQLSTTSVPFREVTICAETDNTGLITVGGSDVVAALATRKGIPLYASDCYTLSYPQGSDLTTIYIDTTVNTDGVTYQTI